MNWELLHEVGEIVFKASVIAWFFMARCTRVAQLPPVSMPTAGPYRTPSPRDEAVTIAPTPVEDAARAINDATAALNERLRSGKISAYEYGEEIEWLSIAARKAGELKKRMRGDG